MTACPVRDVIVVAVVVVRVVAVRRCVRVRHVGVGYRQYGPRAGCRVSSCGGPVASACELSMCRRHVLVRDVGMRRVVGVVLVPGALIQVDILVFNEVVLMA